MPRQLKESELTTPSARNRLKPGMHWRRLDVDVHLGFRKRKGGEGTWLVRWYKGAQKYWHHEFAIADGRQEADGTRVLHYYDACQWARHYVGEAKSKVIAEMVGPAATVRSAIETYQANLEKRRAEKGITQNKGGGQLKKHVLSNEELAKLPLYDLQTEDLQEWKEGLGKKTTRNGKPLSASAIQRITTDFKAALNEAARSNRNRLPLDFQMRIKDGLGAATSFAPIPRHGQALSDDDIRRLLAAAREIDAEDQMDGDLYRLVVLQAATGTRFSQMARITVADLQPQHRRVMIPVSFKGRGEKAITHVAFPLDEEVLAILAPLTVGRPGTDRLFERWYHKQKWMDGVRTNVRDSRGPWNTSSNFTRIWDRIVEKANFAGRSSKVVAYALRHSSIVRLLRLGFPVTLVAALHDTSETSIRKNYAAEIVDALSELVSKAALKLAPPSAEITRLPLRKRA